MVTVFFKTQRIPGIFDQGWLIIESTINQQQNMNIQETVEESIFIAREAAGNTTLYNHDAAPTEPVADGSLNTTDFTSESQVTYSGTGFIKSFTSEAGIFSANQNLNLGSDWTIKYVARATGVSMGQTGFINFGFYKRDGSNNDTLLFSKLVSGLGLFFPFSGSTTTVTPAGSVLTSDRLRLRVSGGEQPV